MRVFVSEYLTSGAWPESDVPASLLSEGRAMLIAVVSDLLRGPDMQVAISWDAQLPFPPEIDRPRLRRQLVQSNADERRAFRELLRWADQALIIAPETGGILAERSRLASTLPGISCWNATPAAIDLCADKLTLARLLRSAGIPTPETTSLANVIDKAGMPDDRYVVKLRQGAGSRQMRRTTRAELLSLATQNDVLSAGANPDDWVVQPFLPGRALSVAGLFDAAGELRHLLPVAEQHLADEDTFTYLGGRLPASGVDEAPILSLIRKAAGVIDGLRGYIGFDIVLPASDDGGQARLVLIEVNPRLTTSYIGYRALCEKPLSRWLNPYACPATPPLMRGTVGFQANGNISMGGCSDA